MNQNGTCLICNGFEILLFFFCFLEWQVVIEESFIHLSSIHLSFIYQYPRLHLSKFFVSSKRLICYFFDAAKIPLY